MIQALIPPLHTHGSEDLAFWEGFLTDEDINFILALPEWAHNHTAQIGVDAHGQVNPEKRITNVGWMGANEQTAHIWQKIVGAVGEVNRRFFHYDLTGCYEPAQLGIYKAEDQSHYNWHSDGSVVSSTTPRKLSMSLLLDDPSHFEGGELQVMPNSDSAQSLEQKRGRAWFFPSWMLHRVTPVTKGTRRSLVLWVGGPAFK
jgi:PKHD-type hydroxylase